MAKEAIEVEAKEERLVSDAVRHLSEANMRINHLSAEFSTKSDESRKQKEEITHLLAQVFKITIVITRILHEQHEHSKGLPSSLFTNRFLYMMLS